MKHTQTVTLVITYDDAGGCPEDSRRGPHQPRK